VDGPKGGPILRDAPRSRIQKTLGPLVRRFGKITIRRSK